MAVAGLTAAFVLAAIAVVVHGALVGGPTYGVVVGTVIVGVYALGHIHEIDSGA